MIRLIVFFAALFVIALGGAWLADRPGSLVLDWQGYRLETSLMIATVTIIGAFAAIVILLVILRRVIGSPGALVRFFGSRRRERGLRALTQGLIAVGAGDSGLAGKLARDARKYLKNEPATQLLTAQAAQLAGEGGTARDTFTDMLDHHATKLLGLHGLYIEARRQGGLAAARHYAEEAVAIAPALPWAGKAVFEFQSAEKDWEGALASLERNAHNKLVDKKTARRLRAVLLTARALELEDGEPDRARTLVREAHGLAPDLVPAAVVAGRLFSRASDFSRAAKVLEACWKKEPHPEIAEAYIYIRPGDSARDRLKRVQTLTQMRAHHPECAMAVARVAIDVHDWTTAREALAKVLRSAPTQRACLLMADVEEGEHGDQGRVREWLTRAVRVPRDPVWIADGVVSEHWAPISPVSGRLDAFEWKVPVAGLAAPEGAMIDEELLAPRPPIAAAPVAAAIEAQPVQPEAAPEADEDATTGTDDVDDTEESETVVAAAAETPQEPAETDTETKPESDTPPADAETEPSGDGAPEPAAAAEAEPVAEKTAETEKADKVDETDEEGPHLVTFPLGHAPDDPGPEKGEEPVEKGRFKLFS